MKHLKWFALSAVLVSAQVYAGDKAGNGGNVVVCRDKAGQIGTIELLDFYEARVMRGFTIDTGAANLSADQKLDLLFARLATLAPAKAKRLRATVESFSAQARFIPGIHLVATPDSNHIIVPDGCDIEQVVNQKEPVFPEDRLFTVSKDLWDKLDAANLAGLVLHETFYHEALQNPDVSDSVAVRYFNGYLCSDSFSELTVPALHKIESYVPFPTYEQDGVEVSHATLYPSNWIQVGNALPGSVILVTGQKPWPVMNQVDFYDGGIPTHVAVSDVVDVQVGAMSWHIPPASPGNPAGDVSFAANGHVNQISAPVAFNISVGSFHLQTITTVNPSSIDLHFNDAGNLVQFAGLGTSNPVLIDGPEGLNINASGAIFNDQGIIQSASAFAFGLTAGSYLIKITPAFVPTVQAELSFNARGALLGFKCSTQRPVEIVGSNSFEIQASEAKLDDQGLLQSATLGVAKSLLTDTDDYRLFTENTTVYFDAQGRAKTSPNN
jgi:hypothetical protein